MIGLVADGVDRELEARLVCIEHVLEKLAFEEVAPVVDPQTPPAASVIRIVAIGLEESGRAGSHNAVDVAFEGAQSDPFVSAAYLDAFVGEFLPSIEWVAEMDAHGEVFIRVEFAVDVELQVVGHIADAGDSEPSKLVECILGLIHPPLAGIPPGVGIFEESIGED